VVYLMMQNTMCNYVLQLLIKVEIKFLFFSVHD